MAFAMADETRVPARRALVLVGLLALTLVVSACGGASKADQHPGEVKVNFCTTVSMSDCKADATRTEERAVGSALRHNPHVVKVVFVSKAEALQRFKKMNPGFLAPQLPANPLPDAWVVTVDSEHNDAKVGKAICAARHPGVPPCATAAELGEVGGVTWGSPLTDRIRRLR
jgi:cell division protein FtsX